MIVVCRAQEQAKSCPADALAQEYGHDYHDITDRGCPGGEWRQTRFELVRKPLSIHSSQLWEPIQLTPNSLRRLASMADTTAKESAAARTAFLTLATEPAP